MSGTIQDAPNTVPAGVSDWEDELNLRELSMKGYDGVSLTEWEDANTDKPEIAAGSVIEIDGSICKYVTDETLADEGGLADGWCYIKHVDNGDGTVTPTLTNTFGTWDTAKQGFYTSGARFSLFAMYRSGAVTKIFTLKSKIPIETGVLGHRYYEKVYTGTVSGASIGVSDAFFSTSQIIRITGIIKYNILGADYFLQMRPSGDFFTLGTSAGTVAITAPIGATYNGSDFKLQVLYKINL